MHRRGVQSLGGGGREDVEEDGSVERRCKAPEVRVDRYSCTNFPAA